MKMHEDTVYIGWWIFSVALIIVVGSLGADIMFATSREVPGKIVKIIYEPSNGWTNEISEVVVSGGNAGVYPIDDTTYASIEGDTAHQINLRCYYGKWSGWSYYNCVLIKEEKK